MNKDTQKTMFSSKSAEWETPQKLYNMLDSIFHFTLDPCATSENSKCKKHFTREENGLKKSWKGQTVFMNPPYGKDIKKWIKKAYEESRSSNTTVVCLLPARTDTKYWHEYCMKSKTIYFVKGRLKFGDATNSAPFPSAVVVFKRCWFSGRKPKVYTLCQK
jgi:site-specific DNA-methyltransferase (adenine-specific)